MCALGVNSILNMGTGALFASQAAINVTGNNISNVNTPGYSRQAVQLEERTSIDYYPGQVGQGVQATEIFRFFDKFVEGNLLGKLGTAARYNTEYSLLRNVETVFNEANVSGMSDALAAMFNSWSKLAQEPNSLAVREALLSTSQTLATSIRNADTTMRELQDDMNRMIEEEVNRANGLIQSIADLNKEISAHAINSRNNPNGLLDERDRKARELAEILDIHVVDNGGGDYTVTTTSGHLLVQEDIPFSLEMLPPRAENNLTADSPYKTNGETVQFDGTDTREYTLEIVTGGAIGNNAGADGAAMFRVSMDGGRTWLKDDAGNDMLFHANAESGSVTVGKLEIYFGNTSNAEQLAAGDKFVITPKSDVYWIRPTAGPLNISSQAYGDGTENSRRITGGTLGGYLDFRDAKIGEYRDRLATFADTLMWEVNRIHSQGSGTEPLGSLIGTLGTDPTRTGVPLGDPKAGLHYGDKLQSGNISFAIYNKTTGDDVFPYPGLDVFSPANFDPAVHSLEDVRDAINSGPASPYLDATIVDGKLQITTIPQAGPPAFEVGFDITSDTTGLAAALGINTFFVGETPGSMGVREDLHTNVNLINAGRVNGAGEANNGDNMTAEDIAALATKKVTITPFGRKSVEQTITNYYAATVTKVGSDTQSMKYTAATETSMAQELVARREEISGVNLDEEMTNLIKFQASYKAAAKLITTADEMIQTLLGLKQ